MKKIMFNDRYGLTQAVLEGRKTMTRRSVNLNRVHTIIPGRIAECYLKYAPYKVGEVVAVAQAYREIRDIIGDVHDGKSIKFMPGWGNKMFVRADLMPHQIRITSVRVERLQEISDEDCLREGIYNWKDAPDCPLGQKNCPIELYAHDGSWDGFQSPRDAFAALINKVSGKGTWQSNPWVFVYEFELVK